MGYLPSSSHLFLPSPLTFYSFPFLLDLKLVFFKILLLTTYVKVT